MRYKNKLLNLLNQDKKELIDDIKGLIIQYINLEAIKLMDLNDNLVSYFEDNINNSYTNMNDAKNDLYDLLSYEETLKNQDKNSDNIFVSKKVMNCKKIMLYTKYVINYGKNKMLNSSIKILKNKR